MFVDVRPSADADAANAGPHILRPLTILMTVVAAAVSLAGGSNECWAVRRVGGCRALYQRWPQAILEEKCKPVCPPSHPVEGISRDAWDTRDTN